jgi:hypothetical protein
VVQTANDAYVDMNLLLDKQCQEGTFPVYVPGCLFGPVQYLIPEGWPNKAMNVMARRPKVLAHTHTYIVVGQSAHFMMEN